MEASDAIDERQLALAGPDTLQVRTDDYVLLRYPDRLRSPTMGLVQAWTYARRPLGMFIEDAERRARGWGENEIRWWAADDGLAGDEELLVARGGEVCDTYRLLAKDIDEETPFPESTEVVADRAAYEALVAVETSCCSSMASDASMICSGVHRRGGPPKFRIVTTAGRSRHLAVGVALEHDNVWNIAMCARRVPADDPLSRPDCAAGQLMAAAAPSSSWSSAVGPVSAAKSRVACTA